MITVAKLKSRTGRAKLPVQKEPHWITVGDGVQLGLAKGKLRSSWIARQRIKGKYRRTTLGICEDADPDNGLSFGQAVEAISSAETKKETLSVWTLDDAIAHYREQKGTVSADVDQRLRRLSKSHGSTKCDSLTKEFLTNWRNKIVKKRIADDPDGDDIDRRAKDTTNRLFSQLRAVLVESYNDDKFTNDGFMKMKPFPKTGRPRIETLTQAQAKKLLKNIDDEQFRLLVACTLASGARFGELTKTRVRDYSATTGVITFRETKADKVRHTPMTDEGIALFTMACDGKDGDDLIFTQSSGAPWNKTESMRHFRAACDRSKFKTRFIFHDLRRTSGSWLAESGVSIQIIADFLGHADPRITFRHYSHVRPSHTKQLIRDNLPQLGIL